MDIVDSFDNDKDYNDDYEKNNGNIPSNEVIAEEADAPAVPQIRAFVAAAFLERDLALLLSSLSLSLSSKLWLSKYESLFSRLSHHYDPEEREGENLGAARHQSRSDIWSVRHNYSVSMSPNVSWSWIPRRRQRQRLPSRASKRGRTTGRRRYPKTGRHWQSMEWRKRRR